MMNFLARINLWLVFIVLFIAHGLMYYSLGRSDWFLLTLSASIVETGIIGMLQYWAKSKTDGSRH